MNVPVKKLPHEAQLVRKSKKGDSAAFGELYDAYIRYIYNFIFYKVHHKETAEDLTSQTFFNALRNITSADPEKSFLSWLYKIAQNIVIDHYRKWQRTDSKRTDIDDSWDIADDSTDIIGDVETAREIAKVKKYLSSLSSAERDVVIMRVWQELSYKEIAEITGRSEASCKMTYSRSIKKLRGIIPLVLFALLITHL